MSESSTSPFSDSADRTYTVGNCVPGLRFRLEPILCSKLQGCYRTNPIDRISIDCDSIFQRVSYSHFSRLRKDLFRICKNTNWGSALVCCQFLRASLLCFFYLVVKVSLLNKTLNKMCTNKN